MSIHYIIGGWLLIMSLPILIIAATMLEQHLHPGRYWIPKDKFPSLNDKEHWDKLVRAGMGNDRFEAMTVAGRLAAFMNEVKDLDGNVYFENTFGGSKRLPRAANQA